MFSHRLQRFIKNRLWVFLSALYLFLPIANSNLEAFGNTYTSTYKLYRKGQFKKSLIYGKKGL